VIRNWLEAVNLALVLFLLCGLAAGPASAQTKLSAAELTPLKSLGSKTAPITVEVFSDFQCPSCKRLYQETLRPLMDNYVSAGKVYLVHRDFPLPMHNHSREAARWHIISKARSQIPIQRMQ